MKLQFQIGFKAAGLIYIGWGDYRSPQGSYCLHFLIYRPSHWVWGKKMDWYDGPLTYYGLGPLFLLAHA